MAYVTLFLSAPGKQVRWLGEPLLKVYCLANKPKAFIGSYQLQDLSDFYSY